MSISIIIGEHMKTLCFKFYQNRAINEKFYFWGGKIISRGTKGGTVARFKKKTKNPYTEWWFQTTAKFSAF